MAALLFRSPWWTCPGGCCPFSGRFLARLNCSIQTQRLLARLQLIDEALTGRNLGRSGCIYLKSLYQTWRLVEQVEQTLAILESFQFL